ncbi:Hypothetical predicted protein [Lynx pardinus]|uniref:Dynein regulatory complex protein 10 n=1 Tax=Lynx pardinus TaxID=191816 RepID=A0A485PQC9_LYNPA|nr:Hypothetical predicted protein [Lynx pardinus]
MALDVLAVAPLYQGPDINRMRLTAELSKKPASPLKPLVPSKSKLTTIETKRVMSVLDETIHKVELVTLLSHLASKGEALQGILGGDVRRAVREHEDLCRRLLDSVAYLQDKERRLQEEEESEDEGWLRDRLLSVQLQKSNLLPLMEHIRESTKDVLRLLLDNPQVAKLSETHALGRSAEAQRFIDCLMELRGFLFEKLLTSPMEAREKTQFIQDVSRQNRRNQDIIDALENELAASMKNRDAEVSVGPWKGPHGEANPFGGRVFASVGELIFKKQIMGAPGWRSRLSVRLQPGHDLAVREFEPRKKYKVETEVENWIQKYDMEMGEKQVFVL